jgi:hypothetical protein
MPDTRGQVNAALLIGGGIMVRRLALAAALAATLAAPARFFDTLWSWAASLVQEEPTPPPTTPPPTTDEDKGYGIDPDG